MNRPAHIAPLDDALEDAVRRCEVGDKAVAEFLAEHIDIIDAYKAVTSSRGNAYSDVRLVESAIRQLGYSVLDGKGEIVHVSDGRLRGRSYNLAADEETARHPKGEA